MLGCFDSKGEDFSFLFKCLKENGHQVITINTGVMEEAVDFTIDFKNDIVAEASGTSLKSVRDSGDRGKALELMGKGAASTILDLISKNLVKGVIGMGGGGGTFITLTAIQAVPLGIPKLCLSTLAGKDLSQQIGVKDVTLMCSVVDVSGLNSISEILIRQAAAAICGMVEEGGVVKNKIKKSIAISAFGNTSQCVDKCSELLRNRGYEVLAFHSTGIGGATMESLIREGFFDAVLDITTTELADDLSGGVCSAGPDRLTAASELGLPQVVVPGCLDMVNFAHLSDVPEEFSSRHLYSWAPDVTLMRTNKKENEVLGARFVKKLNASKGNVRILLPLRGISQINRKGGVFYNPDVDCYLFEAIKQNADRQIQIIEIDAHINDEVFSKSLINNLLEII